MASPPIPPSLEHLASRPFSFYPAILNVEHNEWIYRKATWSEILVVNPKTNLEIWIPRRFIGEVSPIEDPVLIVGLTKELEYKGGMVCPYQRRILQMPLAVGVGPSVAGGEDRGEAAPVEGIRVESTTDRRMLRLVGGALGVSLLLYLLTVSVVRVGELRQHVTFTGADQQYLELTSRDDYFAISQKLGSPASDRWRAETGEIQYRALGYPDRKYTVILMGGDRQAARYIGTLDENWHPVHSVELHSGGTTASLLRAMKRF